MDLLHKNCVNMPLVDSNDENKICIQQTIDVDAIQSTTYCIEKFEDKQSMIFIQFVLIILFF